MDLDKLRSGSISSFSQVVSCDRSGKVIFSDNKIIPIDPGESIQDKALFFGSEWSSILDSSEGFQSYRSMNLNFGGVDKVLDIYYSTKRDHIDLVLIDLTKQYKGLHSLLQQKNESKIRSQLLEEKNKVLHLEKDIIELKNKQFEEIQKYKDRFLAHMSHELKTPLNALLGFAELLADSDLSEEQQEFVEIINSSGNHLLSVVNDILDLTKLEAGKLALNITSFDIHKLLKEINKTVGSLFRERNNKLYISIDDTVPQFIEGDEVRIKQILFNLVENANKFTDEGEVYLDLKHNENDGLLFRVSDNGIGIKEEDLETIFNSFKQAFDLSEHNYGGTGLGLTIVRSLLDLMKGKIDVSSKHKEGTEFTFSIPIKTFSSAVVEQNEIVENEVRTGAKILVAEDAVFNQLLVKELLKSTQQQLIFVDNGRSAMEELEAKNFDLVLMDIQMPIMDGYETIKAIREHPEERINQIPILAMTAHVMSEELERIKGTGANDIILKPLKKDHFINSVQAYLAENKASNDHGVLNMSQLNEISGGERSIENTFLSTFVEQTKDSLSDLVHARQTQDVASMKKIFHKMVNSFNMFEMPLREKVYELSEDPFLDLKVESQTIDAIVDIAKKGIEQAQKRFK
ncbi:MAG: response regulator [Flavobacteriales bacterium]|nr:response regulator [Flavobacteriales bacterium]